MRILCGFITTYRGEKGTVAGFDMATQYEQVKEIGYMSQKFSLYEDLKVWRTSGYI